MISRSTARMSLCVGEELRRRRLDLLRVVFTGAEYAVSRKAICRLGSRFVIAQQKCPGKPGRKFLEGEIKREVENDAYLRFQVV